MKARLSGIISGQPCFSVLVGYHIREILFEQFFCPFQLFRSIFLHFFQFVIPSHGFVFVNAQTVIRKYFHPLYLLVFAKTFTQQAGVFFRIAVTGDQYIAQPEGVFMFFEPGSGAECLFVASSRQRTVAFGIELLDVQQHEVSQAKELFHLFIPDASVTVQTDMDAVRLQLLERGISASACRVGSPPEKVIPPFFPKNAFWLIAICRISSGVVGVPPLHQSYPDWHNTDNGTDILAGKRRAGDPARRMFPYFRRSVHLSYYILSWNERLMTSN